MQGKVQIANIDLLNKHIFVTLALLFSLVGSILIDSLFVINKSSILYLVCFGSTLFFVWIFWSWYKINKSLFDPYVFFVIAAILFNAGQILLEVFNLNVEGGLLAGDFPASTLVATVILVVLSMISFHLGALISSRFTGSVKSKQICDFQANRSTGYLLFSISVIPFILNIYEAILIVANMGYFALYERTASVGFGATANILSSFLIPSAMFILVGSNNEKKHLFVSSLIIFLYSTTQFFLGYRGWATMPIIAYAWLWSLVISPIAKKYIIFSIIVITILVFPYVQTMRNFSYEERSDFSLFQLPSEYSSHAVSVVSEMGKSMQTVSYTLELVPNKRSFDWGEGYLYALLTGLPNVWDGLHPAVARGLPSSWLVWEVSPQIARAGGSLGFSFIAEAYLNFGWYGAPVFIMLLGFLYGKFVTKVILSKNLALYALLASFISFSLYFPRGELSAVVRQFLWFSFLPYMLSSQLSKMNFFRRDRSI